MNLNGAALQSVCIGIFSMKCNLISEVDSLLELKLIAHFCLDIGKTIKTIISIDELDCNTISYKFTPSRNSILYNKSALPLLC